MASNLIKAVKRGLALGLVASVLALGLDAAFDTALGGADRAHGGIGTSPEMPGR